MTRLRIQIGLGGMCAALAATFVYVCAAPLPELNPPVVHLAPRGVATANAAFVAPPEAAFAGIDARPLFNPLRQPIASSALPGHALSGPPPAPDIAVIGVILDSKTQLALIKGQGAPFANSVGVGDAVGEWQVAEVATDHVTLRAGAFERVLRIDDRRQTPPSMPPGAVTQSAGTQFQMPNVRMSTVPPGPANNNPIK